MKNMKAWLFSVMPAVGFALFSAPGMANVFVCTNDDCTTWRPITQTQRDLQSTDSEHTSVNTALANSEHDSIKNGFNNLYDTHIYLKRSLWHMGGVGPSGFEHVTAYVYKNDQYLRSCHVFSYKKGLTGPYVTSCN